MFLEFYAPLFLLRFQKNNTEIFNTAFGMVIGGSIVLAFSYYFGDSDKTTPGGNIKKDEEEVTE